MNIKELIKKHHIADCARCGNECAEACPLYRCYGTYHPQQLARLVLDGKQEEAGRHRLLWGCVTCRACTEACPFDVEFADFIRDRRIGESGYQPVFEGLVHRYQRMQADLPRSRDRKTAAGGAVKNKGKRKRVGASADKRDRLPWLDGILDVNGSTDIALFVGCIPFFESAFHETCGIHPIEMARSAVVILNEMGISPVILDDERCCGRDMYDIGERVTFEKLAKHNVSLIRETKIKTVLTVCPECAYTLGKSYKEVTRELPYEVRHVSEFIAGHIGELDFAKSVERFALHDPCYLARYLDAGGAPHTILSALSERGPVEMERRGTEAPCCGAGSWINHGPHTRAAVNDRLREAFECGAGTLITACPKCLILFHEVNPDCSWKQSPVVVKDLLSIAALGLTRRKKEKS